ncbi:unnamed protein product, partial [Mesorhabditis spiculigera]
MVQWLDELTEPAGVCKGILMCYSIDQPLYHDLVAMDSRVRLYQGLPTDADIETLQTPHFIVIDDQCTELKRNKTVVDLFTKDPYGYLLINNHVLADPRQRLVTHIFPDDVGGEIVYMPR